MLEPITIEDFKFFLTGTLRKKKINFNSHILSDLGCDSVDIVTLVVAVEDKYNINIEEGDIKDILIVKDLFNYIQARRQ